MKVWYLHHSGVAVRTQKHLLIFDYWTGADVPALIRQENCPVIVFVSHRHHDHYNPEIFHWADAFPDVTYILSSDVPIPPGCIMLGPDETYTGASFTVRTLRSTDEGVAFCVTIDGLTIYHAGDLNWWHWMGEPDADNRAMAIAYKAEIEKLRGIPLDLAFVPVDGRLARAFDMGIDHFAHITTCAHIIPIHFSSDVAVLDQLADKSYAQRMHLLTGSGPELVLEGASTR